MPRCKEGDVVQFTPPPNAGYDAVEHAAYMAIAGMVTTVPRRVPNPTEVVWLLDPPLRGERPFGPVLVMTCCMTECTDDWLTPLRDQPGVDETLERVGKPAGGDEVHDLIRELSRDGV